MSYIHREFINEKRLEKEIIPLLLWIQENIYLLNIDHIESGNVARNLFKIEKKENEIFKIITIIDRRQMEGVVSCKNIFKDIASNFMGIVDINISLTKTKFEDDDYRFLLDEKSVANKKFNEEFNKTIEMLKNHISDDKKVDHRIDSIFEKLKPESMLGDKGYKTNLETF